MSLTAKLAGVLLATEPAPEGAYECEGCGARFDLDRQTCPTCGGCTIDRVDWGGVVSD